MKRHLFAVTPKVREQIRAAVLAATQAGQSITLDEIQARSRVRRSTVATVLQAHRAGALDPSRPWCDGETAASNPSEVTSLLEQILSIDSHETCNRVLRRLTVGTLKGEFAPAHARATRECLQELRHNLKAAREAGEDDADHEAIALVGPDVFTLIAVIQGIVSDELRTEVCEFVRTKAIEDRELNPNPTVAEVETLRRQAAEDREAIA